MGKERVKELLIKYNVKDILFKKRLIAIINVFGFLNLSSTIYIALQIYYGANEWTTGVNLAASSMGFICAMAIAFKLKHEIKEIIETNKIIQRS